jgi:hypothetical protein
VAFGVAAVMIAASASSAFAGNWWENIKFKGDFRYRHEMIDKEGKDVRTRHRLRARFGLQAYVSDATSVRIQLATGSDDPVSTNQTLSDASTSKNIVLDMAYFETKPAFASGLSVKGGKFGNPFFKPGKSELIWDSDYNPEGGVATFQHTKDNVSVNLIGAGLWIEERSSGDDSWMGGGQGVVRIDVNEGNSSVAVGGSYFNYVNAERYEPFYQADDSKGNSVVALDSVTNGYDNDYDLFEVYAEFTHKFEKFPMTVMGDFVRNTAADSLDAGWLMGLRLGKASKPGSWALRYIYRKLEKDAVVGSFTDSDFRGGGTDARGHEVGGSYQLSNNAVFNVTYFVNEIGLEEVETTGFNRLQVDLQLKFK